MPNAALQLELPVAIGRKIAEKRRENGLSQVSLASKVGITQVTLSRIEQGHTQPRRGTLARLMHALGIGIGELLSGL